jgi:ABC-2 type transport system ATP-binding protein
MKQRLAIAATLLKSPDLLIFDEPTNGLDPAGIREIRETMRRLGEEGRTVLVSSHILAEVEQVADTVSIIGRGRLLAEGRVADVIGERGITAVRVGVPDPGGAAAVLTAAGLRVRPDGPALRVRGVEDPARITELLAREGIYVRELTPLRADLEQVFLDLTTGEGPGQAPPGGRHAGGDQRPSRPLPVGEPVPAVVEGGEPR